mmetsp:Transcript_28597/g.71159  ORF Transcript_28597/g.71159 Transcript_28597/m.71159 type:complete len:221 (+) Transcript_28597:1119-1781(+)
MVVRVREMDDVVHGHANHEGESERRGHAQRDREHVHQTHEHEHHCDQRVECSVRHDERLGEESDSGHRAEGREGDRAPHGGEELKLRRKRGPLGARVRRAANATSRRGEVRSELIPFRLVAHQSERLGKQLDGAHTSASMLRAQVGQPQPCNLCMRIVREADEVLAPERGVGLQQIPHGGPEVLLLQRPVQTLRRSCPVGHVLLQPSDDTHGPVGAGARG